MKPQLRDIVVKIILHPPRVLVLLVVCWLARTLAIHGGLPTLASLLGWVLLLLALGMFVHLFCQGYGRYLYTRGRYRQGIGWSYGALMLSYALYGKKSWFYGTSLNDLALLYQALGRLEAAEPLYVEAREIRRRALGSEHPAYAQSLNNLARLLAATGRYREARHSMSQGAQIQKMC